MSEREPEQHKNDIYGDLKAESTGEAIPAATVVLLRDTEAGPEVLMLRKSSKIAFGGMWVFPGGRIDEEDYSADRDLHSAARVAAAREAGEEAGVNARPDDFVWFAHWTPPPSTRRRFATWFFATHTEALDSISVDGGEILDHTWIGPGHALQRHREGEIDLAPPTWVTLYHLSRYAPAAAVIEHLGSREPRYYETHVAQRADGVRVALWQGDAGYDAYDADAPGDRHRLVMAKDGFDFEHSASAY
jgi:8-oxo-dGTP pyrophosphatase MutT (NUDIX family)